MDFVFTIYLYKYTYIYTALLKVATSFFLGIPEMYFDKNTAPSFAPKMTKHI
jgi:hypothetical protein